MCLIINFHFQLSLNEKEWLMIFIEMSELNNIFYCIIRFERKKTLPILVRK